eukprot:RCo015715
MTDEVHSLEGVGTAAHVSVTEPRSSMAAAHGKAVEVHLREAEARPQRFVEHSVRAGAHSLDSAVHQQGSESPPGWQRCLPGLAQGLQRAPLGPLAGMRSPWLG